MAGKKKEPTVQVDMAVELWEIDRPKPYPNNPRDNDDAVEGLMDSLKQFGFQQPIVVDKKGVIIVGHTRLKAAQRLGLKRVPVQVAGKLTANEARAYRLADNRRAQDSSWNMKGLKIELSALLEAGDDLMHTGFGTDELAVLLGTTEDIDSEKEDQKEVPEPPEDPVTKVGDLILLGKHRLVCGDATNALKVSLATEEVDVDLVWTDPPYGVSYVGKTEEALTLDNDNLTGDGLMTLLRDAFTLAAEACKPGAVWYVAAPAGPQFMDFAAVLRDLGIWRQTLTWVKDAFVLGRSDYHYRHEVLFYGWTPGAAHQAPPDRKQDTIWEVPRPRASRLHPTMKPVVLVERSIINSTDPGALVFDPFAGSGSTMLACEASGRRAAMLELDPRYCDVIVQRWETATGQEATRP